MQKAAAKLMNLNNYWSPKVVNSCVGQIVQITEEGKALVDYPGNVNGLIEARSAMDAMHKPPAVSGENIPVLLIFENGNPLLPIIIGFVRDKLYPDSLLQEIFIDRGQIRDVVVDGEKMVLDAKEEIMLRCGKSSVVLTKDGKVVIKGTRIVSRASETNKIKGASVKIN